MEATWLAGAAVIPLLHNPHTLIGFQPHKTAFVRMVALIVAAAWALRRWSGASESRTATIPRLPLLALAVFAGAQIIATIFSVDPRASLWGSPEYGQGTITFFAELVIFAAIASHLSSGAPRERLIQALIAVSIPVALYAIIQRAGYDPLAFHEEGHRSLSTLGQPIYLAAYLGMVLPLTCWRIATFAASASKPRQTGLIFYSATAFVQVAAFWCAESRGPLIALLATFACLGVGWGVHTRRRRIMAWVVGILGLVFGGLVFLNLPFAATQRVAAVLRMERLSDTLALRNGPDKFRQRYWEQAVALMTSRRPIAFPSGGTDSLHTLRPFVGYGPETLQAVLPQRYVWVTQNGKVENRLHNRLWDLWYGVGGIGAAGFLAFVILTFRHGARQAGLLPPPRGEAVYWVSVAALALTGAGIFARVGGAGFTALGLVGGLVAAWCVVPWIVAFADRHKDVPATKTSPSALLVIALLSALAGHLVETSFAFPNATTSFLFWVFAAMIFAKPQESEQEAPAVPAASATRRVKRGTKHKGGKEKAAIGMPTGGGWRAAYVPTLILVILLFGFIHSYSYDAVTVDAILARTLTQIRGGPEASHLIWFLFVPTWLASCWAMALANTGEASTDAASPSVPGMPLISGALGLGFALLTALQLEGIGALPSASDLPERVLAQADGYHALCMTFVLIVIALLFAGAAALTHSGALPATPRPKCATAFPAIVILTASVGIWCLALRDLRADIHAAWGRALISLGRLEPGLAAIRRSVELQPASGLFRRQLSAALIQEAKASPNLPAFEAAMREAEQTLAPTVLEVHGLNASNGELGEINLKWAAMLPPGEPRQARARLAAENLDRALVFRPGDLSRQVDRALVDQFFLQQPPAAQLRLEQTRIRIRATSPEVWGDLLYDRALAISSPELQGAYSEQALAAYDMVIAEARDDAMAAAHVQLSKSRVYLLGNDLAKALNACQLAQSGLAAADRWQWDATLAEIALRQGRLQEGLQHLDRAITEAPAGKKAQLLEIKRQVAPHFE